MPSSDSKAHFNRICMIWLRALRFCAWPIIAISVLTAVASVYYTFAHLKIDTNRNALVSSSKHLFKLSENMDRDFGGRDGLVVVAENGHPSPDHQVCRGPGRGIAPLPGPFPRSLLSRGPRDLQALGPALSGAEGPAEDQEQPGGPAAPVDPAWRPTPACSLFTRG